jgi:hypothetical protein
MAQKPPFFIQAVSGWAFHKSNKMIEISICILLQLVLFIPFYIIWRNDCKTIGKDNLAVSLQERFLYWLICCPIWLTGVLG